MIVWGGTGPGGIAVTPVDGAAYDPATDEWRPLAAFPEELALGTRAVWTGDEMVVVSQIGTYSYDPATDQWTERGDGRAPSPWPGRIVYAQGMVYSWGTHRSVDVFDLEAGSWTAIPGPQLEGSSTESQFDGVMRVFRDDLIAVRA